MPKRIQPLSETEVRTAKSNSEKSVYLFDGEGLFLHITTGGSKLWRMKYRFAGKTKMLSMGKYPEVTLKEARTKREEAKKLISSGVDPSQNRKTERRATEEKEQNSFEALAHEWFELNSSKFTPGHGKVIMERLARDVLPWLGKTPVGDITPPEILSVLRRVELRGAVETAHRLRGYISKVICFAIATGRATSDPTRDLKDALRPMGETKHMAAITDPKRLGDLLNAIEIYRGSLVVKSAMKLAALTAVRPGELRHAEWKDIDLEKAEWKYLVTKTNTPHIVPLSRQAVAILLELRPLTGRGRYVFPNPRTPDGSRAMSEAAVLVALRTMGFTNDEMTGHGFRAIFRTLGDEVLRFRIDLIEHQLAHTVRDPLGRAYNRTTHLEERTIMMQQWADYLDALKTDKI